MDRSRFDQSRILATLRAATTGEARAVRSVRKGRCAVHLVAFSIFVFVAAIFIGLAIPLLRRAVPPNYLYGVRTRAALSDPAVWYETNVQGGRDLVTVAILLLVTAGGLLLVPGLSVDAYIFSCTGMLVLGTLWLAVHGWRTGERLLADRRRMGKDQG